MDCPAGFLIDTNANSNGAGHVDPHGARVDGDSLGRRGFEGGDLWERHDGEPGANLLEQDVRTYRDDIRRRGRDGLSLGFGGGGWVVDHQARTSAGYLVGTG